MPEWKEVELKGLRWLVSDAAQVKTPAHTSTYTRTRNGKIQTFSAAFQEKLLAQCKNSNGYFEVAARKQNCRVKVLVHRLVGLAFVPGYKDGLTINHIDGNKLNNCPSNLEWVSLADNTRHQWATGLVDLRGENNPGHKLTSQQVVYIRRLLRQGVSAHSLAVIANVSSSLIEHIRAGRRWPTATDDGDV